MVAPVADRMDFPKAEEEILDYWKSINAFENSLRKAEGRPRYGMLLLNHNRAFLQQ